MRQAAALLTVLAIHLPPGVDAQVPAPFDPTPRDRGRIEGRVTTDAGTGVADVSVTALGEEQVTAVTDMVGRFRLSGVESGLVELRFERLGFGSRSLAVDVSPGSMLRVDVTMALQAIELEPVDVSVEGGFPFLETNGFYRRSRRGFGRQLSRDYLDEIRALRVSDALRQMPGIRLQYDPHLTDRVTAVSPRMRRFDGRLCALTVYVDGVRTLDPDLNQVPSDWLIGMEVYLGADTPARFRTSDSCGVVLLWTRQR